MTIPRTVAGRALLLDIERGGDQSPPDFPLPGDAILAIEAEARAAALEAAYEAVEAVMDRGDPERSLAAIDALRERSGV